MARPFLSPASRGPLMSAKQIRNDFFQNSVSEKWIRQRVAPNERVRLGHSTLRWWEHDVVSWLEGQRPRS